MKTYKFIKALTFVFIGCVSAIALTAPFVYFPYPFNILGFGAVLTLLIFINDCIADRAKRNKPQSNETEIRIDD